LFLEVDHVEQRNDRRPAKEVVFMGPEVILGWQRKKFKIKASQIPRNAAYIEYVKFRGHAAQRRYWSFYEAIGIDSMLSWRWSWLIA
jgi:hypothetical protein